jgi:hypothetical protein
VTAGRPAKPEVIINGAVAFKRARITRLSVSRARSKDTAFRRFFACCSLAMPQDQSGPDQI